MNLLPRRLLAIATLALVASHCSGSVSGANDGGGADGSAPDASADDGGAADESVAEAETPFEDSGMCEGTAGRDGAPATPAEHRAQAAACAPGTGGPPPLGDAGASSCSLDSDCKADGAVGGAYCLNHACAFDQCLADADCASGNVCVCGSDDGGGLRDHNSRCVPARCHVDGDCGPSEFCSPSRGYCGSVDGFFCHTKADSCVDSMTDCGCGGDACIYAPTVGHFVCGSSVCNG